MCTVKLDSNANQPLIIISAHRPHLTETPCMLRTYVMLSLTSVKNLNSFICCSGDLTFQILNGTLTQCLDTDILYKSVLIQIFAGCYFMQLVPLKTKTSLIFSLQIDLELFN